MSAQIKSGKSTNGSRRTPNCKCLVCGKPLYRRPHELAKVRHVACMAHRAEAQKISGITEKQLVGLSLGREKGTNHRAGYKHKKSSKRKVAKANRNYWKAHPEQARARGEKTRGELHYKWNGGSTKLNKSIRQMVEYERWRDGVKARDGGKCTECGSTKKLESHHLVELVVLIALHGIKNRDDARACLALWDVANGLTLCEKCHYKTHGRKYDAGRKDIREIAEPPESAVSEAA